MAWLAPPGPDDLPQELRGLMQEMREHDFEDETDFRDFLTTRLEQLNDEPNPRLSGLTLNQANAILDDDWSGEGPLLLRDDLPPAEYAGASLLKNAHRLIRRW